MVIPLLLGCIINTFFPDILTIGGFTTGLFKDVYKRQLLTSASKMLSLGGWYWSE